MKIKAFKGLRPVKDKAADIASLPYDVVNFEQAAEQAKGKPLSFMRVVRSEIELPEGTEPYSQRSEERRVRKECRSRWSPYH